MPELVLPLQLESKSSLSCVADGKTERGLRMGLSICIRVLCSDFLED